MSNEDDESSLDDATLFRRLMGDARPLGQDPRAPDYRPKPLPRARFRRDEDRDVLRESLAAEIDDLETGAGEALRYHRPSVGRRTMRRLARGGFSVQGEIDLHGMTVAEARPALREFVAVSMDRGHTCIRVVHGKGLGSCERGPILKSKVNQWLRRWNEVLAFVSTRQVDGGTGAVYVLLRKR